MGYLGAAVRLIVVGSIVIAAMLWSIAKEYPYVAALFLLWLVVRSTQLAFRQMKQDQPGYVTVAMLSPQQYEQRCADLLELAGWNVSLVGNSGDQGVDVVAERRGYRAVVQCKNHRHRVGNAAVQQIVAGKGHYRAQIAVVVAPNGYTLAAHALAKSNGVYLLSDETLPKLETIARIPWQ